MLHVHGSACVLMGVPHVLVEGAVCMCVLFEIGLPGAQCAGLVRKAQLSHDG